jgi:hypothetical protein
MSDHIFAATNKGLFTICRSPDGAWKIEDVAFLGEPISVVHTDAATKQVWASVSLGHFGNKVFRSRDNGASWDETPAPEYPPKPEGLEEKDMWGRPIEWALNRIWTIVPGDAANPNVLWAGTGPGGLFRSDDGGDSWVMNRELWDHPRRTQWMGGGADLPMIHSICVDPRDQDHLALGVSTGGVWVTPDGGKSWDCRATGMRNEYMPPDQQGDPIAQDVHRMVQCPANPDVMWIQHHNGIFHSTNGGEHWDEITQAGPSTFGFAVAAHPHDPETAWFVPAEKDMRRVPVKGELVVTRTRDGGRSFDVLRDGLPQQHSYDLTYRHGLDVDESGDRLAFGSTTGGLWVSEDQGDHWRTVSDHLPPITQVRFVR